MKNIYLAIYLLLVFFVGCLLVPSLIMANGTSPVKVINMIVYPASFKVGDTVSISVAIENTARSHYGCVHGATFKVFLNIYKASQPTLANLSWETSQPLTEVLNPGGRKVIAFDAKFRVPAIGTDKFLFIATGPFCTPDGFGQTLSRTFFRSESYSALPR